MSRTSAERSKRPGAFTLVEVMVATSLLGVALLGVLTAYLFLGRNLTRLVNTQEQDVQSRGTVRRFTQDVSAAIAITSMSASSMTLTKPTAASTTTVTYTYTSGNGTLTRTESGVTQKLLSNLTGFTISYYSASGTLVSSSAQSVNSVEIAFTSGTGSEKSGTLAKYSGASPRVVMRNRAFLQ